MESPLKSFVMAAVLKRTVLDNMSLTVSASNVDHAYEIARDFLKDYPTNTKTHGSSIKFCLVENRESLDSETLDIDVEDEDVA